MFASKSAEVFCVALSASRSFERSKSMIKRVFEFLGGIILISRGSKNSAKVHSDLVPPRDEIKTVLKTLDKMPFKSSLCNTLPLIWCVQPPLTADHQQHEGSNLVQVEQEAVRFADPVLLAMLTA